jgi:phospholipase C
MPPAITNVFVLMLENRSFDHMLGFSKIAGIDAVTQKSTTLRGLAGDQSNAYRGQTYTVAPTAPDAMPVDPGHEFVDVVEQLCGTNTAYNPGGPYPPINNSGFVADYVVSPSPDEGNAPSDFGDIMKGFSPDRLPVLNALAKSFAVCDNWFAAIPGPTWPNRLFACAASSSGLDHSPTTAEMLTWESLDGFDFPNGSIFDALRKKSENGWRVFAGDTFPMAAALKGVTLFDISGFDEFAGTVAKSDYPWLYTWIEPNYGDTVNGTYEGGTSQHPMDSVAGGEGLIKVVYEAIRNSPHWNTSLLIITWDEHGGFYDHVAPPAAAPPGDTEMGSKYNQYHFGFDRYGVRVPAVVVSPLIPSNVIDHRLYDHSSIPATIETLFGLPPLTKRDAAANNVASLLSLATPRANAPKRLPEPAAPTGPRVARARRTPESTVDSGNLPGFVHIAMRHELALAPPEARHAILLRVQAIQTRAQAAAYISEVQKMVLDYKAAH